MNTIAQRITNAAGLEELLEILQNVPEDDRNNLDLTSLPTFGGIEPDDTSETWSWDKTQLLVGSCISDMEITDREEK